MSDVNIRVNIVSKGAKSSIKGLQRETDKLEKDFKGLNLTIKNTSSAFKLLGTFVAGNLIAGGIRRLTSELTTFATNAITTASDAEETFSKFSVVFQTVGDEAEKGAKRLTDSFGLSKLEAKELLSATGDLLSGFGFTGESALGLSQQVQELAVDLASFTNFSGGAKGASEALTKALLGERESVKALGISILEEDVKKQVAINSSKGLTFATVRQAKAQATLDIALRQSKNALGDYARTQDSFANVQRNLSKAIEDASIVFGKEFLPILTDLAKSTTEWIRANEDLIRSFALQSVDLFKSGIEGVKVAVDFLIGSYDTLIGILATANTALQSFNTFIMDNASALQAAAVGTGAATAALIIYQAWVNRSTIQVLALWTAQVAYAAATSFAATATGILTGALALLTSPVTLAVVAIGALAAGLFLLVKNFDAVAETVLNFTSIFLTSLAPMEAGFRSFAATLIRLWANTTGALVQGLIDIAAKAAAVFGEELPDSVLNFNSSLGDLADEIENGGGTLDGLATAARKQAGEFRLAQVAVKDETDAIKENTQAKVVNTGKTKEQIEAELAAARAAEAAAAKIRAAEEAAFQAKLEREKKEAALREKKKAIEAEIAEEEANRKLIQADEDLQFIEQQLGTEEALKAAARTRELESVGLDQRAQLEQNDKFIKALAKQDTKARADNLAAKKKEKEIQDTLDAQQLKQRQTFFSLAISLQTSGNKKLVAIGKAAALAQLAIKAPEAFSNSYAFGTRTGGPILGAIFGGIAAAAIAAQAAQIAGVSFQQGGIVPGASLTGDRVNANLNSGEVVLNRNQQSELLGLANGARSAGGAGQEIVVNTVVELDGETVARAVSRQVADGFELGEVV